MNEALEAKHIDVLYNYLGQQVTVFARIPHSKRSDIVVFTGRVCDICKNHIVLGVNNESRVIHFVMPSEDYRGPQVFKVFDNSGYQIAGPTDPIE